MVNQEICNDILRYGEIINDIEFTEKDGCYRQYIIEYEDEIYYMTRHNGEWIFIRREV